MNNGPENKTENRIYEQEQTTEKQEKLKKYKLKETEEKTGKELSKKIAQIDNKLSKLAGNQNGRDFFIKNMNDYIQSKFGVKFEKAQVGNKEELVLVIPENKKANPDPINKLNELAKILIVKNKEIFIDEDGNKKLDGDEMGIKIDKNGELKTNNIYVDKDEKGLNKVEVGFGKIKGNEGTLDKKQTKEGKVISENGKSYYEVDGTTNKNGHYDYLSAVNKLFTAISTKYLGGMDLKTINEKIKNLCYNKKTGEFKVFNNGKPDKGYEKIGDTNSPKWKQIVQPHSKIDLTSLSKALSVGKVEKQPVKIEKKEVKDDIDWGRFYESADGETWDIPDKWNINYKGYSKQYPSLNGSQISICAKNDYDFGDKDKGKLGENTFSGKIKVNLGNDNKGNKKEGYLVIGETSDTNLQNELKKIGNTIDNKTLTNIKSILKKSNTEAWLTEPGKEKGSMTMTEVGDEKTQTITETSDTVEKGQDKNHPIVLSGTKYEFNGAIKGNITFSLEKVNQKDKNSNKFSIDTKKSNLKNIQSKPDFEKAFGGDKAYLLVKNHLVELSWNDKDKKIISKDLGNKTKENNFDVGGINIENGLFSDMKFDKKTGEVEFPEVSGWGKINGKLEKEKGDDGKKTGDILFKLGEEYKIGGKEININLGNNPKLKPNDIFEKTIKGLLFLATEKIPEHNNSLGNDSSIQGNNDSKTIKINPPKNINLKNLPTNNILTKEKTENSDTYIIDAIKKKLEKKDTTKNNKSKK